MGDFMSSLFNQKGFSLTSVMIAAGLIGVIALGVATLSKQMSSITSNAQGNQDYIELKSEVTQYLSEESDCKASLAGVSFKASTINKEPVSVEIWSGDNKGERRRLIATGQENSPKSQIGKIKIISLTLDLPDHVGQKDLPNVDSQTLKGRISLKAEKTVMGKQQPLAKLEKVVQLTVDTDAQGLSVIRECQASADNGLIFCTAAGGEWDTSKGYCILPGTPMGFCTTPIGSNVASGGGNNSTCPDIPNFITRKIRGYTNGVRDHVSCCYIPEQVSTQGWCSAPIDGLAGSGGFEGCSESTTLYHVVDIWGLISGTAQVHYCCFLPKNAVKTFPFCSSPTIVTDDFSGCGTFVGYKHQIIIGSDPSAEQTKSCCWYPE